MLQKFLAQLNPDTPPDVPQVAADASPDLDDAWPVDPTAPARQVPESPDAQLARVLAKLETVADLLTPGVPGHEGAADPVLEFDARTVTDATIQTIPGNRDRTSLLIYNSGPDLVYLVPPGAVDTSRGMPVPVAGEREIIQPDPVRLLCASGETADVRLLEESS